MAPQRATKRRAIGELLPLVAILLLLGALKLAFNPFPYSDVKFDDGAYYYQVARNVSEGKGFVTDVSIYHQSLILPHSITYYPLWPAVLGGTGRLIGLERAAHLLPEALYFIALLLLYVLASHVARVFGPGAHPILERPVRVTLGHVAVLLFGLNHVFFTFTSIPFTEGLAFTLALLAMLFCIRAAERPAQLLPAIVAGVIAGCCYLVRSQLLPLAMMVPASLAWLAIRNGRLYLGQAIAAGIPVLLIVGGWAWHVSTVVEHFSLGVLVDPIATKELPAMPPYELLVPTTSLWEFLLDRGSGLWVSFNPVGFFSYVRSFGPVVYVVPLAALLLLRPAMLKAAFAHALRPLAYPVVLTLLVGLASLAPVYLIHLKREGWSFQFRYGLPLILPIVVSLACLLTQRRILRTLALLCVAGSLALAPYLLYQAMRMPFPPPQGAVAELAAWVQAQPRTPVILSTHPSTLAAITRGAYHHWLCDDPADVVRLYFDHLKVDYLLTYPEDARCVSLPLLQPRLTPVETFGHTGDQTLVLWRLRTD